LEEPGLVGLVPCMYTDPVIWYLALSIEQF
jgi:hypothetical protein